MTANNPALAAAASPTGGAVSNSNVMPTYGRQQIAFARGEGCYLIDTEGKRYLDALAGVAVNALGHSHPGFISSTR
jgi:acetylornithine/N-succinyldiaminopimelate aminotransferase